MPLYEAVDYEKAIQFLSSCSLFNPVLVDRLCRGKEKFFAYEEIFNGVSGRIEYSLKGDKDFTISVSFENGYQPIKISCLTSMFSVNGLDGLVPEKDLALLGGRMKSLEDFC